MKIIKFLRSLFSVKKKVKVDITFRDFKKELKSKSKNELIRKIWYIHIEYMKLKNGSKK